MFCISMKSRKYPDTPTFIDRNGDRVAFKDCDVKWRLIHHFPHHIFECKKSALEAWEAAKARISAGDYADTIRSSFWCRFGDDAPEKIADYIRDLLVRLERAEIIHIDSVGV